MGPHWVKSIVYDWSLGGVAGSSGFCLGGLVCRCAGTNRDSHPTVDLELLRVTRLLCRDSLRAGCRGDERPDTAGSKEGKRGLGDGLHGRRAK